MGHRSALLHPDVTADTYSVRLIGLLATLTALVSLGLAAEPRARAAQQDQFATLEREAARALSADTEAFATRVALVERLRSAATRAPNANQRGRLALLWLQSLRSLLRSIPFRAEEQPPYRSWLAEHEMLAIYSDPAGEWLVAPDAIWTTHTAHKSAVSADEIAWFAVVNGYPGECEGYVPCYANILNWLDGEYLRRHPNGRHASEAIRQIHESLAAALENLVESQDLDFLNPATDCDDLKHGLEPLRQAVGAANSAGRKEAVAVIDQLLSPCSRG